MSGEATGRIRAALGSLEPRVAVVLGSGLGSLVESIADPVVVSYDDLEGFPRSGVSGHSGRIVAGHFAGKPVIMLAGRAHYYEHGDAAAMRAALEALAGVGIEALILTNAAGSVTADMPPGSVMLVEDHINFSGANPLFGETTDRRFVDMSHAYDRGLRAAFERAAEATGTMLHKGVYMWFSGPSFETPAEIRMARTLGADAVGMSTVPEVILGRFLGLRVAACSIITNLAAGLSSERLSHEETKATAPVGGEKLARLLEHVIANIE